MAALTRYSNIELLNLPDCQALLENGTCFMLHRSACKGAGCAYYREKDSAEKANQRLRSLDENVQEHIAQKYYGGSRPWKGSSKSQWR